MTVHLMIGDCREKLRELPDQSVQCVVTSPPYFGLRDYGYEGQLGAEPSPQEFVSALVDVFRDVRRVLRDDGTVWLNLGDSYASAGRKYRDGDDKLAQRGMGTRPDDGAKEKDLLGIPWRTAFALQDDGWYLRQDIIWHKPNPMPESVTDRCTKAHEYLFMLTKSPHYYFDNEANKEPVQSDRAPSRKAKESGAGHLALRPFGTAYDGTDERRNRRSVWTVSSQPYSGAHFAVFPPALVEPCIKAGSRLDDTVLDPFAGSGTTGYVADYLQRSAILIEMNPEYEGLIRERMGYAGMFNPLEVA